MVKSFASTSLPLARVLLLPALNMRVVDVLNQPVHVAQVAYGTPVPVALGDLVLKVLIVQTRVERGTRDLARGVG
jgi:hypothetical protein